MGLVVVLGGLPAVVQAAKVKGASSDPRPDAHAAAVISSRAQLALHLVPSEHSFSHIKYIGNSGSDIILQSLRTNRFYLASEGSTSGGGTKKAFTQYSFKPVEEHEALRLKAKSSLGQNPSPGSGSEGQGQGVTTTNPSTPSQKPDELTRSNGVRVNAPQEPKRVPGGRPQRLRKAGKGPHVVLTAAEAKELEHAISATTDPVLLIRLLSVELYAKGLTYSEIARQINTRRGLRTDRHAVLRIVERFAALNPWLGLEGEGEGEGVGTSRVFHLTDHLDKAHRVKKSPLVTPQLHLTKNEWQHLMSLFLLSTTPAAADTKTFWEWFRRGAMVGLHEANANSKEIAAILQDVGFPSIHRKTPGAVVRRVQSFEKRHPELENERMLELIGHGQPEWRHGKGLGRGARKKPSVRSQLAIEASSGDVIAP